VTTGLPRRLFWFTPGANRGGLPASKTVTVLDPGAEVLAGGPLDPPAMYAMFRHEDTAARAEGFQGMRIIADMDWLLGPRPSRTDLAAFELLLDEVMVELGATVTCAYRHPRFDAPTIADMVTVHPHLVGRAPTEAGFRIWNITAGVWTVAEEIDISNAEVFGRLLLSVARGRASLRLNAAGLDFFGAAGFNAIIQLVRTRPDLSLTIEDARPAFQRCWDLLELHQLPSVRFSSGTGGNGALRHGRRLPSRGRADECRPDGPVFVGRVEGNLHVATRQRLVADQVPHGRRRRR
jgi:anti-anti-sigma regulatory factor